METVSKTVNFLIEEVLRNEKFMKIDTKQHRPKKYTPPKPQIQPVIENYVNKDDEFPEEISKSSEKNDKLMLGSASSKLNEDICKTTDYEKVSEKDDSISCRGGTVEIVGIQFDDVQNDGQVMVQFVCDDTQNPCGYMSDPPEFDVANTPEITSAEVTSDKITSSEITSAEISSAEITLTEITSAEVTSDETTSVEISSAEITSDKITPDKITPDKITSAEITSDEVTLTEITSDEVTLTEITSSEVTSAEIISSEVTSAEITSDNITSAEITPSEITSADIASDEITSSEITSDEITSAEITSAKIPSDKITSAEITSSEITSADIASDEITSAEITSFEITSADIASDEITSAEITSSEITSADIATDEITSDEIISVEITSAEITSAAKFENQNVPTSKENKPFPVICESLRSEPENSLESIHQDSSDKLNEESSCTLVNDCSNPSINANKSEQKNNKVIQKNYLKNPVAFHSGFSVECDSVVNRTVTQKHSSKVITKVTKRDIEINKFNNIPVIVKVDLGIVSACEATVNTAVPVEVGNEGEINRDNKTNSDSIEPTNAVQEPPQKIEVELCSVVENNVDKSYEEETIHRKNSNDASTLKNVPIFYKGKLSRRYLKSSGSVSTAGETVKNAHNMATIVEGYNTLKSQFGRDSYLLNSLQGDKSKADDKLSINEDRGDSKRNKKKHGKCNHTHRNSLFSDSDDSRYISSDCCDSSEDEEEFLGTDEELDMKDNLFNGFQEVSEKNRMYNRRFHQFLNRLSESENEEWYVNAGNLSMDMRKQNVSLDQANRKTHCKEVRLHNKEKEKGGRIETMMQEGLEKRVKDLPSVAHVNECKKDTLSVTNGKHIGTSRLTNCGSEGSQNMSFNLHRKIKLHKNDGVNFIAVNKTFDEKPDTDLKNSVEANPFSESECPPLKTNARVESPKLTCNILKGTSANRRRGRPPKKYNSHSLKDDSDKIDEKLLFEKEKLDVKMSQKAVNGSRTVLTEKEVNEKKLYRNDPKKSFHINDNASNILAIPTEAKGDSVIVSVVSTGIKTVKTVVHDKTSLNGNAERPTVVMDGRNLKIRRSSTLFEPGPKYRGTLEAHNPEAVNNLSEDLTKSAMNDLRVGKEPFLQNKNRFNAECESRGSSPIQNEDSNHSFQDKSETSDEGILSNVHKEDGLQIDNLKKLSKLVKTGYSVQNRKPNVYVNKRSHSKGGHVNVNEVEKIENGHCELNPNKRGRETESLFDGESGVTENNNESEDGNKSSYSPKKSGSKPTLKTKSSEYLVFDEVIKVNAMPLVTTLVNVDEISSLLPKKRGSQPKQYSSFNKNAETSLFEDYFGDENTSDDPLSRFENRNLQTKQENVSFEKTILPVFTSTPVPKKRGRPPKAKSHLSSSVLENNTTDVSVAESSARSDTLNESMGGFSEPSTDLSQSIVLEEGNLSNPVTIDSSESKMVVPKKRGRPPKVKLNNSGRSVVEKDHIDHSVSKMSDVSNILNESISVKNKESKLSTSDTDLSQSIVSEKGTLDCSLIHNNSNSKTIVPKKRGRPPKVKLNYFSSSSVFEKDDIDSSGANISNVSNSLNESITVRNEKVEISDTDFTQNILLKKGNLNKSLLIDKLESKIVAPKKRGRPPKLKLDKSSSVIRHSDDDDKTSDHALETKLYHKEINLSPPKKRGRPTKKNLTSLNSHVNMTTLENKSLVNRLETSEQTSFTHLEEMLDDSASNPLPGESISSEEESDGEIYIPKKKGRKLKKSVQSLLNTDSELVNKSDVSFPKKRGRPPKRIQNKIDDYDVLPSYEFKDDTSFVTSSNQLLGTDIIIINKEKLKNSVVSIPKKRGRKPKSLSGDHESKKNIKRIPTSELEKSDDEVSIMNTHISPKNVTERSKRKRKKIVFASYSDEDDESDVSEEKPVTKKSFVKKRPVKKKQTKERTIHTPAEDSFFSSRHKGTDLVVCGVCKKEMTYQTYKTNHAIFKHYMLCWLDGEENPVDMSDAKDVVNRLWYAKKRLQKTPFKCFTCNLPKLSAVGFQSHIQFCGKEIEEKESLMVTCKLCGARIMPSSLRPHMYIKHSQGAPLDSSVIIPKSKRAAASRAVEVIQSQKEEVEQAEPLSRPASPDSKQFLAQFYIKPYKVVPNEEYARWKTSLQEFNAVTCLFPGCSFKAESTISCRKHYLSCRFAPPRLFKCRRCDFSCAKESQIQDHVMASHEFEVNQHHSSEYESSEESDGENKDSQKQRRVSKKGPYTYFNSNLPFKFLKTGILTKVQGQPQKYFFTEALKWTMKLRKKTLTIQGLFTDAQPTDKSWTPLSEDQASQHLPLVNSSVKFRSQNDTWHSLQRFQSKLLDGVPVLFAGGPVWAMAWAPVPDTETHQYLALATHNNMEFTHEMSSIYNYQSLIQIWSFGHLSNLESELGETPKFLMGIAHSHGAVWSLQFCPSGCFQEHRLGLLAAACSDGSILIYSIPRNRKASECTIYNVQPVMELKLGCEMLTQCTCADWHSVAPHSLIVGGFANGMVALWDLTTTSPLLRDGTTLYPFKVIEAHLSSVSAVSLSPSLEDTHLMTASLDRATKFWRLDDTTGPINSLRKAGVTDAVLPAHWPTVVNAYDDVFSMNTSHVIGYNYRESFSPGSTNFILQSGTVWSLSFNDWLNACACASEMGKVTVFFRQQMLVTEDSKKIKKDSLVGDIFSCSVQPINSWSSTEHFGQKYSECVSNIGLEMSFKEDEIETKKLASACSSDNMDNYPITSVNKVAWNKNLSSFCWLAAGLQCGLVVAPRVKSLPFKDLNDLYKIKGEL